MSIANFFARKVLGKRLGDIELPNESGRVDPRLKRTDPKEGYRLVRESLDSIKRGQKK
jgi:hypothetical protein